MAAGMVRKTNTRQHAKPTVTPFGVSFSGTLRKYRNARYGNRDRPKKGPARASASDGEMSNTPERVRDASQSALVTDGSIVGRSMGTSVGTIFNLILGFDVGIRLGRCARMDLFTLGVEKLVAWRRCRNAKQKPSCFNFILNNFLLMSSRLNYECEQVTLQKVCEEVKYCFWL